MRGAGRKGGGEEEDGEEGELHRMALQYILYFIVSSE